MPEPIDSVEQAQERERAQNTLTPEQVLETIHTTDLLEPELYAKLQQMKPQLMPFLQRAMQERKGFTRLKAGHLLLYLGDSEGTEAFVISLQHPDELYLPRYALIDLMGMKLQDHPQQNIFSHLQPLPLRRNDVFTAVVPYLQDSDEDLRKFAVYVLANLDLPQTEETILPLLHDRNRAVRFAVVQWLAAHNQDRGALSVAEELLSGSGRLPGEGSVIDSLETYIKSGNPAFSERAVALLVRYVLKTIQQSPEPAKSAIARIEQTTVANELHHALEAIAKANTPREKQVLSSVVNSSAEAWVRGHALARLVEIDSNAALPTLQAALSDRVLGEYAAETLAKLVRNQPNTVASIDRAAAIKTLLERLNAEQQSDALAKFLDALLALNGDIKAVAPSVVARLNPFEKMQAVWATKELTPKLLGDHLIQAGIIAPLSPQQWQEIEHSWQKQKRAFSILIELLSTTNKITIFDAETSIPVDYKKLLATLTEISHGRLQVSAVSQFEQQDTASSSEQVQFVYSDRVYRFYPKEMGDWYDVDATLNALNRALKDSGHPERFIALEPDGQFPIVVFAPEAAFQAIAREFAIPLAKPSHTSL